jgi:hypothetical protein
MQAFFQYSQKISSLMSYNIPLYTTFCGPNKDFAQHRSGLTKYSGERPHKGSANGTADFGFLHLGMP